ncbi:MAG: molybdenum cofactor biosynthesis protein MoaE [Candidatus Heimdallarchaeota archaeon]
MTNVTNYNMLGQVLEKDSITLTQMLHETKKNPNFRKAGDIITFTGVVRETTGDPEGVSGKKVEKIEIQVHKEVADRQLTLICQELIETHDLIEARIVHFYGIFSLGDVLVHCIVASKHRTEGFTALKEMIEAYKHRAYIWKAEIYTDGSEKWISTIPFKET